MPKPRILVLPVEPLYSQVITPRVEEVLDSFADWDRNPLGREPSAEEFAELAAGYDGILQSWGHYKITKALLAKAPRLKMVAHAAGSIKALVEPEVLRDGFVFTSAAPVMAPYVAECAVGLAIAALRGWGEHMLAMRVARTWGNKAFQPNKSLFDSTVGLVGLGQVGRCVVPLLRPFRCTVLAFDPYCAPEKAAALGVELAPLDRVLGESLVVTLHAAITPETHHLIGKRELGLMQDGSVLVNTARGWLLDHDALLAETQSGRIRAALDVTDPEPLPPDHPLRDVPGVILLPHQAGPTWDRRWDMGYAAATGLRDYFAGKEPQYRVTYEMLATMA